ncbi:hypothetical protein H7X68_02020 [Candidatus Saccharibacteria bacterium]|nr:hypothetical protein [Candidatus Saccharibacteria bacterium]
MSRLVELANQGDAAIARFSKEHLPQSDEAIAKRARARKVISGLALTGVLAGGDLALTNEIFNAADHQAQHVQEVSDRSNYEQLVNRPIEVPTLPSPEK